MAEILDNSVFGEINENEINNESGNKPEKTNYIKLVLLYPIFLIKRVLLIHFIIHVIVGACFYMALFPVDFNKLKFDIVTNNFMGNKNVKAMLFVGVCFLVISSIYLIKLF